MGRVFKTATQKQKKKKKKKKQHSSQAVVMITISSEAQKLDDWIKSVPTFLVKILTQNYRTKKKKKKKKKNRVTLKYYNYESQGTIKLTNSYENMSCTFAIRI